MEGSNLCLTLSELEGDRSIVQLISLWLVTLPSLEFGVQLLDLDRGDPLLDLDRGVPELDGDCSATRNVDRWESVSSDFGSS